MTKFDASCGLTEKTIGAIKYRIKTLLNGKHLPILSENVEMKLFFEGRDAWVFNWELLKNDSGDPLNVICIGVTVKLKKEFHGLNIPVRYRYLCKVKMVDDIYRSVISIKEEKIPSIPEPNL